MDGIGWFHDSVYVYVGVFVGFSVHGGIFTVFSLIQILF